MNPLFSRACKAFLFLFLFCITFLPDASAQDPSALKVFLNCSVCDKTYLRSELNYVDHVRDQSLANVQIFIVRTTNGSGGRTYEMEFEGFGEFDDIHHKQILEILPNATRDEIRSAMRKRIEIGLLLYLLRTDLSEGISVKVKAPAGERISSNQDKDPWNFWIFRAYGDFDINQQSVQSRSFWQLGFRADRVTEELRIRTNGEISKRRNKFIVDEQEIFSRRDLNYFNGSLVKSLSNHWSMGVFSGVSHNTYDNRDFSTYIMPAIEFSFFPYSEVIRKEVTAAYRVGYVFNDYLEETIYIKDQEHLFRQTLALTARFNQDWGRVWSTIEASSFMHDFSKRSLEMDGNISFRVFRGLSVRVSAEFELINDQLSLPRRDATVEEILLRQRQLATNFDLGLGLGISYTFGSMFNNVVNTRL
ncbi:MAG: hypothetical protein R8P61_07360 [Bacteroidia bacterium]|nr:hypothetical protein [Bacteroidia bacterium]